MIGLESPAHLPLLHFCKAPQAFSSTSSIFFTSSNGRNFIYSKLCRFKLLPNLSFFVDTRRTKSYSTSFRSFVSNSSTASPQPEQEDAERKVPDIQKLIRRFWKVAVPYWFSDDQIQARWR